MEKTENGKVTVVGVRFRTAGRIYYFDPGDFELTRGNHVIVETARGLEYGYVVGPRMEVDEKNITQPLKPVIRISTEEDDIREKKNREREREAFWICRERIQKRGLEMKLIDAEYTFDNSKVLFYFTADGRVDFRELVKDLAGVFRTRIELRQVGVRDETKILGGYGSCGRPLCCHTWLSDFVPVSIKMAKEQNLSLNPGKISGVCGRLMCCLKNEAETYEELNKTLPHPGDEVESADGMNGLVESVNILRQTARIIVEVDDEKELHEYSVSDLTILRRRKRGTSRPTMQKNNPPQKSALAKDAKEAKETKESKDSREGKEAQGRDKKEAREGREGKGNREGRGGREPRDSRDSREARGNREPREINEFPESYENREAGDSRENRENGDNISGNGNNSSNSNNGSNGNNSNNGRDRGRKDHGRNRRDRRSDRRQDRRQNRDDQSGRPNPEQKDNPQE